MYNSDLVKNNVCFVVVSCDKYSDLWPSFFKNLHDKLAIVEDYKVYLVSNYLSFNDYSVINIKVGQDISWSSNFFIALNKISEENIFLLIDDLYLRYTIQKSDMQNWIDIFVENDMNYLRLTGKPKPTGNYFLDGVWEVSNNEFYRTATVFSFWKKKTLLELLDTSESAWDFEYFGSKRANRYSNWYSTKSNMFSYYNLVIKGKINPFVLKKISKSGYMINTNRPIMKWMDIITFYFKISRSYLYKIFVPDFLKLDLRVFLVKKFSK
jgi:hypothetical protein